MLPGIGDADRTAGHATGTQSLYRKYRPASFDSDDLVGQDHIVRTLRNAIARDRVAHAYLFCGPRGTGKTSTARLLAKAVNCLDADPEHRPCNACESCDAINQGRATDIIEIDAASNRGIDDMREIRERVRYAPSQLRTKFYIVDEVHQITKEAFNAFLKTLEEPPPNTIFVLATTDPDKLPDTIASRCQRFDFRRIAPDVMARHVRAVCDREGIKIDDEALDVVVRRSFGGMRDALSLVDQLSTSAGETADGNITLDLVRTMLGISAEGWEYDLAQALASRDIPGGLRVISQAVEGGQDMRSFGRRVVDLLRVMMLVRAGADPVEAKGNQRLIDLAGQFELPELLAINRHFHDIDYKIRTGGFPQLPIELAFLGALVDHQRGSASPQQSVSPPQDSFRSSERAPRTEPQHRSQTSAEPRRPRATESSLPPQMDSQPVGNSWSAPPPPPPARAASESTPPAQQGPAASREKKQSTPEPSAESSGSSRSAPPAAMLQTLISSWERIRTEVRAVDRKAEALLRETDPAEVQGNDLRIVAAYPFHASKLNDPRMREIIEDAVQRVTGVRLTVNVVARDDVVASPTSPSAPPSVQEASQSWGGSNGTAVPEMRSQNGNGVHAPEGRNLHSSEEASKEPAHSEIPDLVQRVKVAFDAEEVDADEAARILENLKDPNTN